MGPVTNNTGIVTQGQVGNNYQTQDLVAYHGEASLEPDASSNCFGNVFPSVVIGNYFITFRYTPFTVLSIAHEPTLVLDKVGARIVIKTLKLFDGQGTLIAFGDNGHIQFLAGARAPEHTSSSFIMYDRHGDEILNLSYSFNCALSVRGVFMNGNEKIVADEAGIHIKTDHITYTGSSNWLMDASIIVGENGLPEEGTVEEPWVPIAHPLR
jgi:hypothetical protein